MFFQSTMYNFMTYVMANYVYTFRHNLRDRDNLSTMDKRPVPNVSIVRRFHCIQCTITTNGAKDSWQKMIYYENSWRSKHHNMYD